MTEQLLEQLEFKTEIQKGQTRGSFPAVIIEAGMNKSGTRVYPAEVLRASAHMFENAKMFVDHKNFLEGGRGSNLPHKRSVNDLAGIVKNVHFDDETETLRGEVVIVKSNLREIAEQVPELVRMSINAKARVDVQVREGKKVAVIQEFMEINSVDFVTVDGAGGRILKVLESLDTGEEFMSDDNNDKTEITLEMLKEEHPEILEELKKALTDEISESIRAEIKEELEKQGEEEQGDDDKQADVDAAVEEALSKQKEELEAKHSVEMQKIENEKTITEALNKSKLPEKSVENLRKLFTGKTFEDVQESDDSDAKSAGEVLLEELEAAIEEKREELASVSESGKVDGLGDAADNKTKKKSTPLDASLNKRLGINDIEE